MTTVNVTAEHITQGIRDSCTHCPVGLALRDAIPAADVFADGATFTVFPWEGGEHQLDLPAVAEEFIVRFDDDGYGEPFSFDVDYPAAAA